MSGIYGLWSYLGLAVVLPLGVLAFLLLLAMWLPKCLVARTGRVWTAWLPFALLLALLVGWGSVALPLLNRIGGAIPPNEHTPRRTAGVVEKVEMAGDGVFCLHEGAIRPAAYVTVNGETFYFINDGQLLQGMLVALEYAPVKENLLLSWWETDEAGAALVIQAQQAQDVLPPVPQETPKPEPTPGALALGRVLSVSGMACFALYVGLQRLLERRYRDWLLDCDRQVEGQILPNKAAMVLSGVPVLFLCMVVLGACLQSGSWTFLVILVPGSCAIGAILLRERSIRLRLRGEQVVIQKLGSELVYPISGIRSLQWQRCKGFVGKQMQLILEDGSAFCFPIDHYTGVEDTFRRLEKELGRLQKRT